MFLIPFPVHNSLFRLSSELDSDPDFDYDCSTAFFSVFCSALYILQFSNMCSGVCFTLQDIYNAISTVRQQDLSLLTSLQALLKELQAFKKWYVAYEVDSWDQLNRLFFAYQPALKWLAKYPDILFIDATYKTN